LTAGTRQFSLKKLAVTIPAGAQDDRGMSSSTRAKLVVSALAARD
jgi:hypothetical protein